jgi:hypothetical protein
MHPDAPKCTRMHPRFAFWQNEPTAITPARMCPNVPSPAAQMCRNVPSDVPFGARTRAKMCRNVPEGAAMCRENAPAKNEPTDR